MTDMLILHSNPMSRGAIARWMLEEVGAPYEYRRWEFGDALKSPEFLRMNRLGKLPVLQHGAKVVSEVAAICAYLADAFPEAGLAPPLSERDQYYRWLFFAPGPLEASVVDKALGVEIAQDKRSMSHYGEYARVMDALQGAVEDREFVGGNRFSAADVVIGSHLMWGMQFGTIEKRPGFEEYAARLAARPARQRAAELDAEAAK